MLKVDLHMHAHEDPIDCKCIQYTSKDLIRHCAKQGFNVLALTFHDKVYYPKEIVDFAKKKDVLLIQGCEATIEGCHTLVYGVNDEERKKLKTYADLEKIKDQVFVTAPHPFFVIGGSVGGKLVRNIKLFDAIEYCHFYTKLINRNKPAVRVAKQFSKPLIGQSDAHHLETIGSSYSLIDASKDRDSVFEAIRKHKVEVKSEPMSLGAFLGKTADIVAHKVSKLF